MLRGSVKEQQKIENYKICGERLINYISVNVRTKVGNMNSLVIVNL